MPLEINLRRDDLFHALGILSSIAVKKGSIAVLANILIESADDKIVLTATDLEIGVKIKIDCELFSHGSITVPAKKMFEIVRESKTDFIKIIEKENNWIKIESGSSFYNLAGLSNNDFPTFPEYEDEGFVSIESIKIKNLIDKIIFSVAADGESQFNLTGGLLQIERNDDQTVLRMVSSDGHRLSLMEVTEENETLMIEKGRKIIIPRKGLQEIKKMCEMFDLLSLKCEEKQIIIKADSTLMIIRLLGGDFPDYKKIVSLIDDKNFIRANREVMLSALKRINLFTEDNFHVINFRLKTSKIELSSQSAELGNARETFDVEYDGDEMNIYFNGRYFIECLQALNTDTIKMHISSENSPCFVKSDEEKGFVGIIMPMKM